MINTTDLISLSIIDTHLHLWDIEKLSYPWLETVQPINRSFLIKEYQEESEKYNIEKMVFVQCECHPNEALQEVAFVTEIAKKDTRLKGIVAYLPIEKGLEIKNELEELLKNDLVKGVRRMYGDTPDLCLTKDFLDGLKILGEKGIPFDICITPKQLKNTLKMVQQCPNTTFVIDHMAKPLIGTSSTKDWRINMELLALHKNVYCKISGLLTEYRFEGEVSSIKIAKYISHIINIFSYDRVLFGSDWPVCRLNGGFDMWMNVLQDVLGREDLKDLKKLFFSNAELVYNI